MDNHEFEIVMEKKTNNINQLNRLQAYHDRLGDCVRNAKVSFISSGGNASKNAKSARITLPNKWIRDMGITPDDREVTIRYANGVITICKKDNGKDGEQEVSDLAHSC